MVPIGKTDWNAIRAEYIGGTMSQRKLAEKHGVSPDVLMQKANKEHWKQDRDKAVSKGLAKSQQKAADAIADNATIAARIRTKLLLKLEKEIDALPTKIGSEHSTGIVEYGKNEKGVKQRKEVVTAYKLRDLSSAFKDLTADMVTGDTAKNDLMREFVEASKRRLGNG